MKVRVLTIIAGAVALSGCQTSFLRNEFCNAEPGQLFVGQKADAFIQDMRDNAGSVVADSPEGERLLVAWRRSEASGWRVSAAMPLATLDAPVYQSLVPAGIIVGIAIAVGSRQ